MQLLINVFIIIFCFPAAAAESSLRLLSSVAQEVKGRGTISWIDCRYVSGCFSTIFPSPLLAFIADLAFFDGFETFCLQLNPHHSVQCLLSCREPTSYHLLFLWTSGRESLFPCGGCHVFFDSMVFSLKLETPSSITSQWGARSMEALTPPAFPQAGGGGIPCVVPQLEGSAVLLHQQMLHKQ